MPKKGKKTRLYGNELVYISDSSNFTGELSRIGLSGIKHYIRTSYNAVMAVREMAGVGNFDEELVCVKMQEIISTADEIDANIQMLENSLIRFIHAGRDTHLFEGWDVSKHDWHTRPVTRTESGPSETPLEMEEEE